MKSKKAAKKPPETIKTFKTLQDDTPVHIPVSFEAFIKKAVNTPIKNSKINKK